MIIVMVMMVVMMMMLVVLVVVLVVLVVVVVVISVTILNTTEKMTIIMTPVTSIRSSKRLFASPFALAADWKISNRPAEYLGPSLAGCATHFKKVSTEKSGNPNCHPKKVMS